MVMGVPSRDKLLRVENGDEIDFLFLPLCVYSFVVEATDNLKEAATHIIEFKVIVTVESMTVVVKRLYELNFIDNKGVKNGVLMKLEGAKEAFEKENTKAAENKLKA